MLESVKDFLRPAWQRLRGPRARRWPSETSKCRARLAAYCTGDGVDLGFGGDPVNATAVRIDLPEQYGNVGNCPAQLRGDASRLLWFRDGVLDYVFSSHLLEDFRDTESVLREWLRVLKVGGRLVLYCPDEQRFRAHCERTGQPLNAMHVHEYFSLEHVKILLSGIGGTKVLHECPEIDAYSWELVVEKTGMAFANGAG